MEMTGRGTDNKQINKRVGYTVQAPFDTVVLVTFSSTPTSLFKVEHEKQKGGPVLSL